VQRLGSLVRAHADRITALLGGVRRRSV